MSNIGPLVSIAMATYNGEKYLRQQLDSIYNQTYKNIEVIVTDDCSSDKTTEILEEYHQLYGLTYYVNDITLGYAKNFERAASLCSGDLIAFSDQDDIFLPDKIEVIVREIGDYSLLYSDSTLIDEKGEEYASSYMRYVDYPMLTGKPFKEIVFSCFIRGFQMVFTCDLLRAALPMPDHVTHDDWFSILAAKRGGIKYLDLPLVQYRQHGRNVTGTLSRHSALREYLGIFRNFNNQQAKECRRNCYQAIIEKLDSLRGSPAFSEGEKGFIDEVALFYRNQIDSVIHWRSFLIALKNYRVIAPQKSNVRKAKFVVAALLHQ